MTLTLERKHARRSKAVVVLLVLVLTVSGLALTTSAQDPPTLFLRAKATEDVKIDLDWEMSNVNMSNVVKYNIYWDTKEIGDISGLTPDATTTDMEYTVSGLKRGEKHHFVVAAVDSGGTVLAQGSDSSTPAKWADIGHLKVVNYWNVMTFTGIILVIYLYVLWKIPTWVKEEEAGGA
jgi:hypothetical protein